MSIQNNFSAVLSVLGLSAVNPIIDIQMPNYLNDQAEQLDMEFRQLLLIKGDFYEFTR